MPKRSSSRSDLNEIAASIVERSTANPADASPKGASEKNAAAVALGRLGGLKGGRARAAKLSEKRRKQIARKAATVRWAKK